MENQTVTTQDQKPNQEQKPETQNSTECRPKRYYGVSIIVLLLCNFIMFIPVYEHLMLGGMQGMIILMVYGALFLISDLVLLFPIAAILRRVMPSPRWGRAFRIAAVTILAAWMCLNTYRAMQPLPYMQIMLDEIPNAVEYFAQNNISSRTDVEQIVYENDDLPAGPMINIRYVYVARTEDYPKQTGEVQRTLYIHPLDEHWYLELWQAYAA